MSTRWKSLDEIRADYLRVTAEIEERIAGGPPPDSGIAIEAWRSWHRHGFVCCVQQVVGYWKCCGPSAPLNRTAAVLG
jgi:hypothetical protein